MSPYLFVLVMEYFNRSLKTLEGIPNFNYHPRCAKQKITHICFTDDLILCCRADKISIRLLMSRFQHFSEVSELKVNMEKSALYIAGVSKEFKKEMMTEMSLRQGRCHSNTLESHCQQRSYLYNNVCH